MLLNTTGLPQLPPTPLGYRFGVTFLHNGKIPNPIDMRFQSVSGIGISMEVEQVEKSVNTGQQKNVPKTVKYDDLVLERGVLIGSPLSIAVEYALRNMKIQTSHVLVSVLDESGLPLKNWMFFDAYPVKWSISGIEATNNNVLIENITLSYSRLTTFSL